MLYNLELFGINTVSLKENSIFKDINERKKYHQKTGEEKISIPQRITRQATCLLFETKEQNYKIISK